MKSLLIVLKQLKQPINKAQKNDIVLIAGRGHERFNIGKVEILN